MFTALVELVHLDKYYANFLGFSFALIVSYLLTSKVVFLEKEDTISKVVLFFASTFLSNLIFSNLFLFLLTDSWGVNYLIAKNFSIAIILVVNYLVRKFLIFKK